MSQHDPSHGPPIRLSIHDLSLFFEEAHRPLAERLTRSLLGPLASTEDAAHTARALAELGLYSYLIPERLGGAPVGHPQSSSYIDVRSLVLIREALGQISPLADAVFSVQGIGSYPIVLAGSPEQHARYLGDVIMGRRIGAFALTEPEAGSDAASLQTTATREGDSWVLDGEKIFISNVPIADYYVVFVNADPSLGRKGIAAFIVDNGSPGFTVAPIAMSTPHPLGKLRFERCRVPDEARLGDVGAGFRLAMQTLDAFRISVGAAANGMATAALAHALAHVKRRRQFGAPLADQQIIRAYLAEMATELDAARLLVARAAHRRDQGERASTEAAMAKMYATEAAQRIIDHAVQLHGGSGVVTGSEVEKLYREIRPLRIYEGTTEIQKMIIAKAVLAGER